MFNNDITLNGTSTPKVYSLTSVIGGKSVRADATQAPGLPRLLTIGHQAVNRSGYVADRHLVRLDLTQAGVSPDTDVQVSVQLVIEMPRRVTTAADVQDIVDQLEAFTGAAGYIAKVLNSEP